MNADELIGNKMLKYNGKGVIEGVPARDLTEEEARWFGGEKWLVKSGFYTSPAQQAGLPSPASPPAPSPGQKRPGEGKMVNPEAENKAVLRAPENK